MDISIGRMKQVPMMNRPPQVPNRKLSGRAARFTVSYYAALSILPEPLLQHILSYLQPAELGRISTVDKQMNTESSTVAELCVKKILREVFLTDATTVLRRLTLSNESFSFKKFLSDIRKKRILVLNGTSKHSSMFDIKKNSWESKSTAMTQHRAAFSSVWYRGELVVISGNVPGKRFCSTIQI